MCQGSRMINVLYSSNNGIAPTSPHAVAEISPWGVQREMYHLLDSVLLPLNRRLRSGALQTEKDAYISMTLMLRHWRSQHSVFVPLPSELIYHNSDSYKHKLSHSRPLQACFRVGRSQAPMASPSVCYVIDLPSPAQQGMRFFFF